MNGYAIGIGCIVTYCCDLIVASEKAEWRLPQSRLGIMPAQGGTVRVARWVGKGLAMRLAYGFPLPADEAYRIGLAQWLVPPDKKTRTAGVPKFSPLKELATALASAEAGSASRHGAFE